MIAVVSGASDAAIQALFRSLVDRWQIAARVAGVIAVDRDPAGGTCKAGFLQHIGTGRMFPIFQDLGPRSEACDLDGAGALTAALAVQQDIAAGCDLVVLSKFGKLEGGGTGLRDAFVAAAAAHLPILTSVSPAVTATWSAFADSLAVTLPAEAERVDAWWQSVRPRPGGVSLSG